VCAAERRDSGCSGVRRPRGYGVPTGFALAAAGGLIAGLSLLAFAATGLGRTAILPSVAGLPEARVLAGVSGVTMVAMAAAVIVRYRWGLLVWLACAVVNYAAPIPYIAWRYKQAPGAGVTAAGLSITALLIVYGWINRGWFRGPRRE
jgi:hypothetical protein